MPLMREDVVCEFTLMSDSSLFLRNADEKQTEKEKMNEERISACAVEWEQRLILGVIGCLERESKRRAVRC